MNSDNIDAAEYFWLVVNDESMIGEHITDGDLALVQIQPDVESGEMAAVIVNGKEGIIRRIYKDESSIVLQSSNPTYPPRIFSGENVNSVRIVGKVKEFKRKL